MTGAAAGPGPDARREDLRARLLAVGFDEVRFADAGGIGETGLQAWLDAGHQADMHWMARTADKRMDPVRVLAGAQTVIMLGVNAPPGVIGYEK